MSASPLGVRLKEAATGAVSRAFFTGASSLGRLLPVADLERQGIEVTRDVPYLPGADAARTLDVYRPPGPGPFPTVFYVHGGGFRILSKETHWIMGAMFARAGYLVFNINYRLAPTHPFPAALEDIADAYAFVARHGARFGADLSQLVIAGESAGGNLSTSLALMCATDPGETTERGGRAAHERVFATELVPRGAVPACGVLQVSDIARFGRANPEISRLVRSRMTVIQNDYLGSLTDMPTGTADLALADPLIALETRERPMARPLPAFFVPCGTKDPLLDDTRRVVAALDRLGVPARASYYPGEVHAFHAFVWRPEAKRCWSETYDFLRDALAR